MQDDPNFPKWAQAILLLLIVAVIGVVGAIVGGFFFIVLSWIASGSH